MRAWLVRLAPVLVLFTAGACDSPFTSNGDEEQRRRLAEARERWEESGVRSYSYTAKLDCFCAPADSLLPVRVTVRSGQAVSRAYVVGAGQPARAASEALFGAYDTVEELFEVIEDQVRGSPAVLNVSYDETYGFPNVIAVDPAGDVPNDQRAVLVTGFAVATTTTGT
ncbi:MAG TPA: DUF6174 domain-containing protein [Longimicrobium sp.]|uniref:DUF6174 domain-containing protein n=1 Tax=Longimicrobium sp. TaxID=2029185 RepID=UPI002ED8A8B2